MATNVVNPAQSQLVVQNYFNLVQAIASKIKRRLPAHVDVDDLVQTGMIGLLEASRRFDATRQVDFASYANSRITGAILDELRKWDTCSRQDRRTSRQIEQAKQNLRASKGCEPSREEIAKAVGLGLEQYDRTLHRLESAKQPSLQSEDHDSDPSEELNRLPSKDATPYEVCCKTEDFKLLRIYLNQLKPRYRQVLELYYFKDMGLKMIGEELGVGEARISQIHKQAVTELRRLISAGSKPPAPMVSTRIQ
ncbi:MAG TPA: FliA/WhiG family RNA polymerase sigma factor [Candidatus Angelobacter sp.]|nr:FliA/WhiG family RNA polymerase sigma factor [Candidatus Angelobacter sp.]